jgi:hypothetical protein
MTIEDHLEAAKDAIESFYGRDVMLATAEIIKPLLGAIESECQMHNVQPDHVLRAIRLMLQAFDNGCAEQEEVRQ